MNRIEGIGTDIVEIERIKLAVERYGEGFLKRLFTRGEQSCCSVRRDRYACYAARFAAKEAVLKAIGSGLSGCKWTDVEVIRPEGGRPRAVLHGSAAELARVMGIGEVMLSLSHDRGRAVAFAVALRKEDEQCVL